MHVFINILAIYNDYFPTYFIPIVFQNLDALLHCAVGTQSVPMGFIYVH